MFNPQHVSAYILKIEQNTVFSKKYDTLNLPDEEAAAEQYLFMCSKLCDNGYNHYEISNFAKDGYESKHNMNCWEQKEYIGFGLNAHSYVEGVRYSNDRFSLIGGFVFGTAKVRSRIGL